MANLIDSPPTLQGDEAGQLIQIHRYLQQMSDALNEAIQSITIVQEEKETEKQNQTNGGSSSLKSELRRTSNTLKSMIIKSAEIVRTEMDEIRTTLESNMTAISQQFGQIDQQLSLQISANAEGIQQNFEYIEEIRGKADVNEEFRVRSSQYIFSGLLYVDQDTGLPVYGIAIGDGITQYVDGEPTINNSARLATFTKEKLSFWQGTTEVAYFSNRKMHIENGEIRNKLKMGHYAWKIQADGSMGLKVETAQPPATP